MAKQTKPNDDDIPAEIDFSGGTRGKFANPDATLELPVCLDADIKAYLAPRAEGRGIAIDQLVNELLKTNIELIEAAA